MAKIVRTKGVRRIILIGMDGRTIRVQGKAKKKKRRVRGWLRPIERLTRRALQGGKAGSNELLRRHNRSTRKKRRRWVTDMPKNMTRANWKAFKKIRRIRFL